MTDQEILNKSLEHILNQGQSCMDCGRICHEHPTKKLISAFGIHIFPEKIDSSINYQTNIKSIIHYNKKLRWMYPHSEVLQEIILSSHSNRFIWNNTTNKFESISFLEDQIYQYVNIAKRCNIQPPPIAQNFLLLK